MLQIAQYQAVAPEGKKIHWCYFGLYSELCGLAKTNYSPYRKVKTQIISVNLKREDKNNCIN